MGVTTVFKNGYISHHMASSWHSDYFQPAAIGQEFVVDDDEKVEGGC
jgi:hypothetical protein